MFLNLLKEKNNKKKYKSESARWIFVCCSTWTFVVRSTLIRIYTQRLWIVCVTSLLYFSSLLYLFITEQKLCVVEFRLRFVKIRVNAATFVSLLLFTKKWSRWKTHSSRTLKVYTSRMKLSTEQFGAVVVVVSDCYFFPHCPPYTSATPQSKCTHIVTKHIEREWAKENETERAFIFENFVVPFAVWITYTQYMISCAFCLRHVKCAVVLFLFHVSHLKFVDVACANEHLCCICSCICTCTLCAMYRMNHGVCTHYNIENVPQLAKYDRERESNSIVVSFRVVSFRFCSTNITVSAVCKGKQTWMNPLSVVCFTLVVLWFVWENDCYDTAIAMATATQPYTFLLCLMRHAHIGSQLHLVTQHTVYCFDLNTLRFVLFSNVHNISFAPKRCVVLHIQCLWQQITWLAFRFESMRYCFPSIRQSWFVIRHRRTMRKWKQIQSATLGIVRRQTFQENHNSKFKFEFETYY